MEEREGGEEAGEAERGDAATGQVELSHRPATMDLVDGGSGQPITAVQAEGLHLIGQLLQHLANSGVAGREEGEGPGTGKRKQGTQ